MRTQRWLGEILTKWLGARGLLLREVPEAPAPRWPDDTFVSHPLDPASYDEDSSLTRRKWKRDEVEQVVRHGWDDLTDEPIFEVEFRGRWAIERWERRPRAWGRAPAFRGHVDVDVYMVYEGMKVGPGLEHYRRCGLQTSIPLPPPQKGFQRVDAHFSQERR